MNILILYQFSDIHKPTSNVLFHSDIVVWNKAVLSYFIEILLHGTKLY